MASFDYAGDDSIPSPVLTHPFDHDAYAGYGPRVSSQQFGSFDLNSATDSPIFNDPPSPYSAEDDGFHQNPAPHAQYQSTIYAEADGTGFDGAFEGSNGPILPPPTEMGPDEGYALREWRRKNAIRLEEKEKREKELLNQIIDEADEYKVEFYRKRIITCENNKITNREREKVYQANQEKFHSEADKNRWKAIAELLPSEVPAIETRRGKKDQEKKPSINVVQGPKPGKPTDLSRMRQILLKLKHNTPPHLKPVPPPAPAAKDPASTDPPSNASVSLTPQAVVVVT